MQGQFQGLYHDKSGSLRWVLHVPLTYGYPKATENNKYKPVM